ncbi:uroporphyrinogen decarboxylase [Polychytrium aggregatum]|uniref:uroporphyrinogen decarboxylase n=1 Tax=Polychytrium aggregatum TaxID=110093 RepID=UPI0022FE51BF|nr:uroporphyrinogen decarboxylase [Polychytrium aggregatum]KAI9209153.1 uroporphyrinogen decarboxylase [Polychytrium aggregatum]
MATLQTNFPPLKNDLILRVSRGEQVERTPVWIMRQAGRYLPEFRAVKVEHDFFAVCQDPELACKVTLQPIDRYPGLLDASIIFSDILVIPQALGLEVIMVPGKGPHFPNPIVTPADLVRVDANVNVHEKLKYVYDAITLTRTRLDGRVPLFGFVGAPWTLMAYSIEGGGSKTLSKAKSWLYVHPEESHRFMQIITDAIVPFLVGQVKAGAQMLQVFDSWAGELSPSTFKTFSLPYLAQIATRVKAQLREEGIEPVPMTVFAKGAHFALAELSELEYEVVSLDWTIDIEKAQRETQGKVVLQGNADPCVLYGDRETIRAQVKEMIEAFGKGGKHVANLGHGIYPDMDPEHLRNFLEAVRDFSTVAE